jgi:hypothetical protein
VLSPAERRQGPCDVGAHSASCPPAVSRGRWCRLRGAGCLLVSLALVGCRAPSRAAEPPVLTGATPAPAPDDRGDLCFDIGEIRVCAGGRAATWVPRPLPPGPPPPAGWRCGGQKNARSCISRALDGAPFACEPVGQPRMCTQTPLRTPDTGEWECVEMAGVVTCRSLGDAAGVQPGRVDPSFLCGRRRGTAERLCVDFSPDPPPAVMAAGTCRVRYRAGAAERACVPSGGLRLGGRCSSVAECPRDAACVDGRCLPPPPAPACWFDQDCGQDRGRRCRWGTCLGME